MDKQTQADKINGFNNMFGEEKKDYTNYHSDNSNVASKKVNKPHTQKKQLRPKSPSKSSNSNNNVFHSTKIKKPSRYGNIRVKQNVVDELGILQLIVGTHSRSDLLEQMIEQCKKVILNTHDKRKFYKDGLNKIQEDRKFQSKNIK